MREHTDADQRADTVDYWVRMHSGRIVELVGLEEDIAEFAGLNPIQIFFTDTGPIEQPKDLPFESIVVLDKILVGNNGHPTAVWPRDVITGNPGVGLLPGRYED